MTNITPAPSSRKLRNYVRSVLADCKSCLPTQVHAKIEEVSKAFFEYRRSVQAELKQASDRHSRLEAKLTKTSTALRKANESKRCLQQELKCSKKRLCATEKAQQSANKARAEEALNVAFQTTAFAHEAIGAPEIDPSQEISLNCFQTKEAREVVEKNGLQSSKLEAVAKAQVTDMIGEGAEVRCAICDDLLLSVLTTSAREVSVMIDTLDGSRTNRLA